MARHCPVPVQQGEVMNSSVRAASIAAFLITTAFFLHNFNGEYYEPYILGFEEPTDYADMEKIASAQWSFAFTSSGIAHIVTGFSMLFLGLGLFDVFRSFSLNAARLILVSASLSGLGFLLTGVSDIPLVAYGGLIINENPAFSVNILLMTTLLRGAVNTVAIAGLSWFAGQVAWCTLKTGLFSKGFAWLGYLNVLPGLAALALPVAGFIYLKTAPLWMLWLGVLLWKLNNSNQVGSGQTTV
jgi:hypothetical protein